MPWYFFSSQHGFNSFSLSLSLFLLFFFFPSFIFFPPLTSLYLSILFYSFLTNNNVTYLYSYFPKLKTSRVFFSVCSSNKLVCVLYMLWLLTFYQIWFANISSILFCWWFSLLKSHFIFPFVTFAFGFKSKKIIAKTKD